MIDPTDLLAQYGPYVVILYLLVKDVLPKAFPQVAEAISKRVSTEQRLFTLLEKSNDNNAALASSLTKLELTLNCVNTAVHTLSERIDKVEDTINGANSVIGKLIKQ